MIRTTTTVAAGFPCSIAAVLAGALRLAIGFGASSSDVELSTNDFFVIFFGVGLFFTDLDRTGDFGEDSDFAAMLALRVALDRVVGGLLDLDAFGVFAVFVLGAMMYLNLNKANCHIVRFLVFLPINLIVQFTGKKIKICSPPHFLALGPRTLCLLNSWLRKQGV